MRGRRTSLSRRPRAGVSSICGRARPVSRRSSWRDGSDDLYSLGRLRLADRLIEPYLVAVRVHHLEGPVAPPLRRNGVGNFHLLLLLQFVVIALDVLDPEVDLDGF